MKRIYFALVSRRDASALLIAVSVLVIYGNSIHNAFQYDDRHSIVENTHLRTAGNIPSFFTHPEYFSRDADKAMYRPLLLVSFALNYALGKYNVVSYHLVNIGLHLLCTLLLWGILRRLEQPPCMSLLGALFFAVHPLASEPVNYISSRSELMAAAGVLGGVLFYQRGVQKGALFFVVVSLLCFAAGLLSKSVAIVLPLWIVIWEWQRGHLAASWYRLWPYALVAGGYVLVIRGFLVKAVLADPVRTWPQQLATQVKALVYYALLLLAPLKLNVDHAFTTSSVGELGVWFCALALGSLLWCVSGQSRQGILWILAGLLPTLVVPLNVLVNEHRLYLPLVGLVVAILGIRSLESAPGLRWGAPLLLAFLALITIERNSVWSDELSLWGDAAIKNPTAVRPLVYLGNAARQAGEPKLAEIHYRRALALDPQHLTVRANLANVYQDMGRYDLAVDAFAKVLTDQPGMTDIHYSLGRALQLAGRFAEARDQYRMLPVSSPHRALAVNNLGAVYEEMGKIDSALYYYGQAGQLHQARHNRGRLLGKEVLQIRQWLDAKQFHRAENHARLLLAADEGQREPHFLLAVALFLQGRYGESIVMNQQLVEAHPDFDEGILQLALALESSGRFSEAEASYQELTKRTRSIEMNRIGTERLRVLKERMP